MTSQSVGYAIPPKPDIGSLVQVLNFLVSQLLAGFDASVQLVFLGAGDTIDQARALAMGMCQDLIHPMYSASLSMLLFTPLGPDHPWCASGNALTSHCVCVSTWWNTVLCQDTKTL